jgi:lipopolysaccharide biosynthesis regulator YciM
VIAAELALKSKNSEPAVDYYLKVLELDSTNIFAITNLTDYYRDRKEYEKSFYYLNKSFRSSEIDYSKKMAILSYYLSDEYFFNNHTDLLEELILTMLEKYEGNREIHLFGTDFFIQNKKYKEALNSLIPILNEKEKKYELWRQGIYLANAIKQFEEMLTLAESAMKIFPDSVEVIYYKGIAEFESEKYNNFIKTFSDKNIKSTKNREIKSQARILLAEAYNKLENYPKSDSLFRSIILEEPKNFAAMNNFGYYLSIRNESLQEAKRISYIAIENNPDNGTYLDTYAWILYKLKDYKNAELFILEALKKGGINDPDINEHAAEIHKAIGSYELARSFYQKAIVVGGDKEKLIQKLEEIKGINGQ